MLSPKSSVLPFSNNPSITMPFAVSRLPSVSINGCECADGKPIDLTLIPGIGVQPKDYVDNDTVCLRFIVDNSVLDEYSQKLTFESGNECSVEWIEIDVV